MRYLKQFILTATHLLIGSMCFAQDNLPVSGQIAGHDYIDLGLPSGTLWATYNVGATTPEEYGDYFAWGETEPKEVYNWDTYKYAKVNEDGKFDSITKYNMSEKYGIIDSLSTLLPEDDAATANWGKEWRMPTIEEQRELYENSYMVWTDGYNGTDVSGVIFYKAKSAEDKGKFVPRWETPSSDYSVSDDAHVFLPNDRDYYWSSSLNEDDEVYALYLYIITKGVGWDGRFRVRVSGYPVRAVANKTTDIEEYVVSFYTQDSVLIESQKVEKGKSATAVDAPVVDGYEFIGWSDSSFTNVMKDLDIYAQYKAITKDTLPVSGQIAGHDYVDLGLPSGTLWATYNVGATKPEQYGYYFAWGETEPKEVYADSTYKWFNADSKIYTKYNSEDGLTTLLPEDDAATANWGSEWRMPTDNEQWELYQNSYMVWTDGYNGTDVSGVIFYKAKEDSDKGTYISRYDTPSADYSVSSDAHVFFPAAGYRWRSGVDNVGYGYYWSSSLGEENGGNARYLEFYEEDAYWGIDSSSDGFSVRAVATGNQTNTSNIISNPALKVYAENSTIHVANAQANTKTQVFDMNGKTVASVTTDADGNAEIMLSASKGVYVVSDDNQSTKIILK